MGGQVYDGFERLDLSGGDAIFRAALRDPQLFGRDRFDELWDMHPAERPTAVNHGREVELPRWQYAFDRDYSFTGQTSVARPRPALLDGLLGWVKEAIDPRLNGILVNAYDGRLGDYIGPHRDETRGLVRGSPIVTVSLGEGRSFRIRPWKGKTRRTQAHFRFLDFPATDGTVFVMPAVVNDRFTHEVPDAARHRGRRLSVTFRVFAAG